MLRQWIYWEEARRHLVGMTWYGLERRAGCQATTGWDTIQFLPLVYILEKSSQKINYDGWEGRRRV